MGVYRARCVPGRGKNLRSESELQAGGTGRSVFGNRRSATDEASPGPAAVPDGRVAALARQAWLEIPSPAGGLAFSARLADGVVIAATEADLDPEPFIRRAFAAVWEQQ